MASVNITATFCNSNAGAHASVTLTVNSVAQGTYRLEFPTIQEAITDEQKRDFVIRALQLHLLGKTAAQLRTNMLAGINITV